MRRLAALVIMFGMAEARGDSGHRGHGEGRDRFKNPKDLEAYVAQQEHPSRAAWQKPDQVLKALAIAPGQTVCDIGAGPGYFALRAARLVGERGRVLAVDVDPRILAALRDRIEKTGVRNVTPVLGLPGDPLLAEGACDLLLLVDVYHHFPDGRAYLRGLARSLRPGGRLVNIDWHKRATAIGPEMEHRVAREVFLEDARAAGFKLLSEPAFLPHQYFLILERG